MERRGSIAPEGIRGFIPAGELPEGDFQIEHTEDKDPGELVDATDKPLIDRVKKILAGTSMTPAFAPASARVQ